MDETGQLRKGTAEVFPSLWQNLHSNPSQNTYRPNGLWLAQGLTALENSQDPTFRCLLSKESAAIPTTLKDFVHRAFQEQGRAFDLSGDVSLLIYRLNETEPTSILFREHLASGRDFPLQWGDIIEIPARPFDSKLPEDEVTTFLQSLRPIDLAVTLGDNQILTNANNPTGEIFRYQPKSSSASLDRVRIAAGIVPLFLKDTQIFRPDPDTGKLVHVNTDWIYSGDRIHFQVQEPKPGPVTHKPGSYRFCQSLSGPFWESSNVPAPSLNGLKTISERAFLDWLPQEGLPALLLALSQPHGLPLQAIDWKQAHVLCKKKIRREGEDDSMRFDIATFFSSPPRQQVDIDSFILVLPPAEEETPFPQELKEFLTDALSTSWSLKIGLQDPVQHQWAPRFPVFSRENGLMSWQASPLTQQNFSALPLTLDLVNADPESPRVWYKITSFTSQKLIRIDLYQGSDGTQNSQTNKQNRPAKPQQPVVDDASQPSRTRDGKAEKRPIPPKQ